METSDTSRVKNGDQPENWAFHVEGFGQAQYADLTGFVPFPKKKQPRDLAVNEMTVGQARLCGVTDTIRLWRTR